MIKSIITSTLVILIATFANGQDMNSYNAFVKQGDSLYGIKQFSQSAEAFEKAFDSNEGKANINDRYNAACSYALAGDTKKAFHHLFYLAENSNIKYKNYNHITIDPDLKPLHKNQLWDILITLVNANKDEAEKDLDKPLVAILGTIFKDDQTYRSQIGDVEKKYGRDSDEMKKHWDLINLKDSINVIKIQKILDEKGWLGARVIGNQGNSTFVSCNSTRSFRSTRKIFANDERSCKERKCKI